MTKKLRSPGSSIVENPGLRSFLALNSVEWAILFCSRQIGAHLAPLSESIETIYDIFHHRCVFLHHLCYGIYRSLSVFSSAFSDMLQWHGSYLIDHQVELLQRYQ